MQQFTPFDFLGVFYCINLYYYTTSFLLNDAHFFCLFRRTLRDSSFDLKMAGMNIVDSQYKKTEKVKTYKTAKNIENQQKTTTQSNKQ